MKKGFRVVCVLMLLMVMFVLSSCSTHQMKRGSTDPYQTPMANSMPDEFTLVVVQRNLLFSAAVNIQGMISVPLLMYKDGVKDPQSLRATDYSKFYLNAPQALLAIIPEPKSKLIGNHLQVVDRCGTMACNPANGNCRYVKGKLNSAENADTLYTIRVDSPEVISVKKGTAEYEKIVNIQRNANFNMVFVKADKATVQGIKNGSSLSEAVINDIAAKESFWGNEWKKLIGSGWKVMLAYPILTPQAAGFFLFITKVQEIPSFWTSNDVLGCVDYKTTAYAAAEIAANVVRGMPSNGTQSIGWDDPLPSEFLAKIAGTVCDKKTYREYAICVAEFNKEAERKKAEFEKRKLEKAQKVTTPK
jgi:hypothetical protein